MQVSNQTNSFFHVYDKITVKSGEEIDSAFPRVHH